MSLKNDFDYLRDMLQYAEDAQALAEGHSQDDLANDEKLRYAINNCLLIIGEAASRVSEETREKLPDIPWREIKGMQNWLVHGYSALRSETIWETVHRDLPALASHIMRYLPPEQS